MNKKFEDLMKSIVDQFIKEIESGKMSWEKMWTAHFPANAQTKRVYEGFNAFYLGWLTKEKGWTYPYFLTFNQAKKLGGNVIKGEKSATIVFWKWSVKSDQFGEPIPGERAFPYPFFYNVFNIDQCQGLDIDIPELEKTVNLEIKSAKEIYAGYIDKPRVVNQEDARAYYSPMNDFVNMPKMANFKNSEAFYQVLFHELVHSTGHHTRLNRFKNNYSAAFGSTEYSKEELVAEIGASFLCHRAGIAESTFKNSAAYLQGWAREFKDKPTMLYSAANKALDAVYHILGIQNTNSNE